MISVLSKAGQFEKALARVKEFNVFLQPEKKDAARVRPALCRCPA